VFIIKYVIERVGLGQAELRHDSEEAFGKEKGATTLGIIATEKEGRKPPEPM
jgi:hypothetical protein